MVAKEKPQRKKDNSSRDTIIAIVIFLVLVVAPITFLIFNNVRMQQKRNELVEQERALRAQLEQLEERKIDLEATIESINSVDSQEKILREQGLYKKPGEEVITIVPAENEPVQVVEEEERTWWNPLTW